MFRKKSRRPIFRFIGSQKSKKWSIEALNLNMVPDSSSFDNSGIDFRFSVKTEIFFGFRFNGSSGLCVPSSSDLNVVPSTQSDSQEGLQ